jgi:glycosyltransferase involved in cell wall biosynthesis
MARDDQFFIWTHNFAKGRHACSYYRIEVPFTQMAKQDLALTYEDTGDGRPDSAIALMYSDVMHQYSLAGEATLHRHRSIQRRNPADHRGQIMYPPAIIYDSDDNTDFVHPFNTTYGHLGTRAYPDAHLLEPGDVIQFDDPNGNPIDLWIDQETKHDGILFDIGRNLHEMKIRHTIIREANGATASCRALASYYQDVIGQKNTYVFPNTIVPEHFEHYDVVRKDDKVRILWQGSNSHYVDWYPLRDALKQICEKYKDKITFVIYGEKFPWIHNVIPDDMIEHHAWTPYEAYKLKRGLLNADINLCPLVDNVFNRCKSAIKWYEASIWDRPEATLAQKTEPYHEIEDNVTGLLFSDNAEFVEKLSLLIEDADLRKRLGAEAKKWVLKNRTPERTIPGLFEFYEDTRARQKRDLGGSLIKPATMDDLRRLEMPTR